MANPTTNYGFVMPTSTDLVTDLPADFDVFGQAVDTQMLTNANAAIAKAIVDAKGDIIVATAADTVSLLAVGANDTVLTADSAEATGLKWATPASGSLTSLATGSLSGAAVTISSISGSYKNLVLQLKNVYFSSDEQRVRLTVNSTSNIYREVSSGLSFTNPTAEYYEVAYASSTNTNTFSNFTIYNYAGSTKKISRNYIYGRGVSGGSPIDITGSNTCSINLTSAITSITLTASDGTFSGGTYTVFGVN